jgi:hypothetical protein
MTNAGPYNSRGSIMNTAIRKRCMANQLIKDVNVYKDYLASTEAMRHYAQ